MRDSTNTNISSFNRVKSRIYKRLTLFLFFILPERLTTVFVNLSLVSMIYSLRDMQLHEDDQTKTRLSVMLNMNINDSILLLPEQTFQWYWDDRVLSKKLDINGSSHSVKEIITSNDLFIKNRNAVLGVLIDALPKSISVKLKLSKVSNRLTLKHSVTSVLIYM